jgi:PIN domain nuclease of toxin-antitoxin system
MTFLIDTHILLWLLMGDKRLSTTFKDLLTDSQNIKLFSKASLWEIAVKTSIGKLDIPAPLDLLVPKEIAILDIVVPHFIAVQKLPFHHKDPFDRLLIAQALTEDLHFMSDDQHFQAYGLKLI